MIFFSKRTTIYFEIHKTREAAKDKEEPRQRRGSRVVANFANIE